MEVGYHYATTGTKASPKGYLPKPNTLPTRCLTNLSPKKAHQIVSILVANAPLPVDEVEPVVELTLQEDGEGNIILVASSDDGTQASLLTIDSKGHILLHSCLPHALGFETDDDGTLLVAFEDIC